LFRRIDAAAGGLDAGISAGHLRLMKTQARAPSGQGPTRMPSGVEIAEDVKQEVREQHGGQRPRKEGGIRVGEF